MYHTSRPVITGSNGVVSSGHYLATMAGAKMLAQGGNAIDAGVAAGFVLAVVKPYENSFGGECPILVYSPIEKKTISISGQGAAPRQATIQWFKDNGINMIPGDGYLGATVPGLFGAYATALIGYGRLKLEQVMASAIEIAEHGFPIYKWLREGLLKDRNHYLAKWPSTAAVYLIDGKVPNIGFLLKQPALADTMRKLVQAERSCQSEGRVPAIEQAIELFYKGEIADQILAYVKNVPVQDVTGKTHVALLEKEDFMDHETKIEEPVYLDYKGYKVCKCGPWTQGPVFLQQLKLLEGYDIRSMKQNSADYIHLLVECAKLAFADRNTYYGDPCFNDVPLEMLFSDHYNNEQRKRIDLNQANNSELDREEASESKKVYVGDTTHLDVADREGWMMSATCSGGWIPSSPIIPELGFPLGTRAQCLNLMEGHPNCLQPGKRPRVTLTPSMVYKDDKPWLIFGTPGGDYQDQWTLQFFLNLVEFDMDLQEAIDKPSFHSKHFRNSFYPKDMVKGTVFLEKEIELEEMIKLQEKGHVLNIIQCNDSAVNAVRINHATGMIEGAASNKYDGQSYAFGW